MRYIVGVDDTDSQVGCCTTYLGYRLVGTLIDLGCKIPKYPRLVRLNPNVPFKTRGNAAVAVEFESEEIEKIFEEVCSVVEELSDVKNGANSGVVLVDNRRQLTFCSSVYKRAISEVVNRSGVLYSLKERGAKVFTLGNGMGVIGAAAGIGFDESLDHTYELIAYRTKENCGTQRDVDRDSVKKMDQKTFPLTFNNYDYQTDRVLITPHGPDPVFFGIRGDSPKVLLESLRLVEFEEDLEGHMIYVTNQCTDAHLDREFSLPLKAYSAGKISGKITRITKGEGGHLYLELEKDEHAVVCAVYEPAGDLRKVAQALAAGDFVEVAGGVRRATSKHDAAVNVERIRVISLARQAGCGKRRLIKGIYIPSPRARRHLAKPLVRYGREAGDATCPLVKGWFSQTGARLLRVPARSPRSSR